MAGQGRGLEGALGRTAQGTCRLWSVQLYLQLMLFWTPGGEGHTSSTPAGYSIRVARVGRDDLPRLEWEEPNCPTLGIPSSTTSSSPMPMPRWRRRRKTSVCG